MNIFDSPRTPDRRRRDRLHLLGLVGVGVLAWLIGFEWAIGIYAGLWALWALGRLFEWIGHRG